MKVIQINTFATLSTGRIAIDLSKTLEDNGHESRVFYSRGIELKDDFCVKFGNKFDITHHALLTRITDRTGFYSKFSTKNLIKQIEKYNPDIIHLHNLHGYYINIPLLFEYLKEINKPVVWTLHDCWAFTGHCAYYSMLLCDKWKKQCYECPQKQEYPKSILKDNSKINYREKKRIFNSLDNLNLVVPSNWLAGEVSQSFLKQYPTFTIYNGIDLEIFKPTKSNFRIRYNLQDKYIILGVASTWSTRKGLDIFIKLSKVLNSKFKIILIGLSKEQLNSIPSEILGFSRTESLQELAAIYTTADIYFNASKEEVMGLTTVEALACGTPAMVFDSTAIPEVIDNECGIVITSDNDTVENIVKIINDLQSKKFSTLKCIERAKNFEKKQQFLKYIKLYEELIK